MSRLVVSVPPNLSLLVLFPLFHAMAFRVAGAIAAGNTVVLKPSNVSVNTANLLGRLVPKYMDPKILSVAGPGIRGDRAAIGALLKERWDKIFFTGTSAGFQRFVGSAFFFLATGGVIHERCVVFRWSHCRQACDEGIHCLVAVCVCGVLFPPSDACCPAPVCGRLRRST